MNILYTIVIICMGLIYCNNTYIRTFAEAGILIYNKCKYSMTDSFKYFVYEKYGQSLSTGCRYTRARGPVPTCIVLQLND